MHSTSASQAANTFVVDSWQFVERLWREWSHAEFEDLLRQAAGNKVRLLMHEINLGEVFYLVAKNRGEAAAKHIGMLIEEVGVETISVRPGDALRAASLKAKYPMSYADCFCANLAMDHSAPVLTGDKDFLNLQSAGLLTDQWLGA